VIEQPTGIIKCLPQAWVDECGGVEKIMSCKKEIDGGESNWYMSFPNKPRRDVLHLYVVFDGLIQFRVNIMEFKDMETPVRMTHGAEFTVKLWAICTGPMVIPSRPLPMKGFRGYRYTAGLF